MSEKAAFRQIVRLLETDVDGDLPLIYGLAEVKGIGVNFALAICNVLGLNPRERLGYVSEDVIRKIEDVVNNPAKYRIPMWMYNRRKDYQSGEDVHVVGSHLLFLVKEDIEREKRVKSWRGIRHALGLKVRGQRTRTTGRLGATVGVKKRKAGQPGGK